MGNIRELPRATNFWAEMAPCDHVVHIYGDDSVFLDALEGFVGAGLQAGEAGIVIATPLHIHGLEARLRGRGIDVEHARADGRLITCPADDTLDRFMVNDWPDEKLFLQTIRAVLDRARGPGNRKIRAFGEMVAILWSRGLIGATLQLEVLWNALIRDESFPLFCAYPRDGFTKNPVESLADIRSLHSRAVA